MSSTVILSGANNLSNPPGATTQTEKVNINDRLHTELWTSWASLIRSYAAAHGLNSRHHAVVEVGADEITLRVANRWLRFTHDLIEDSEGNRSTFSLQEDGTVKLKEHTEEMDLAAERLAREMMSES
jgi:DNA-binding transcriptional regulator PaaX